MSVDVEQSVSTIDLVLPPAPRITARPPSVRRRSFGLIVPAIVIMGMLITSVSSLLAYKAPGVYWADSKVVFMPPLSVDNPNGLLAPSESLIDTAGLVASIVGSTSQVSAVSDSVTLLGEGITKGYRVRLPNSGGQWQTNFDQSLLDVQASGPSAQYVRDTMNAVLGAIQDALNKLQAQWHVDPLDSIRTIASPADVQVFYVTGSRTRALIYTFLFGCGLTVAAAVGAARWQRTSRRRQRQTPRVS